MSKDEKSLSKFLSIILRHKPETIGLTLDEHGWAEVDELITKASLHNMLFSFERLNRIVEGNDKQRFIFSDDRLRIRANQGHSINVDLQLKEKEPPHQLFHGTALKNIESIKVHGLLKGERHHVHLSADTETAVSVGKRYGKPSVIRVDAEAMYREQFKFYESENKVWLTDYVPVRYLRFES